MKAQTIYIGNMFFKLQASMLSIVQLLIHFSICFTKKQAK